MSENVGASYAKATGYRPAPQQRVVAPNAWPLWRSSPFIKHALIYSGFLYFSGALLRLLNGGEVLNSTGVTSAGGTIAARFINGFFLVAAVTYLIFESKKLSPRGNILLLAIVGLALASAGWSSDAELTFQRGVVLAGTTLCGLALAAAVTLDGLLRLLNRFSVGFIVSLAALAITLPHYAFHQATDFAYSAHAGELRGSYFHKNDLGDFLALFLVIIWISEHRYLSRRVTWIATGLGIVLLAMTNSMEGIVGLGFGMLFYAALKVNRRISDVPLKLVVLSALVFFVAIVVILLMTTNLFALTLALLGRDPTLTNRTTIWYLVFLAGKQTWLLGSGYNRGWSASSSLIKAMFNEDVGYSHNGYLDIWLQLGLVGVILVISYVWVTIRGLVSASRKQSLSASADQALVIVMYYVVINIVSVHLLQHDDLFWLLMVTFCQKAYRPLFQRNEGISVAFTNRRFPLGLPVGRR